MTESLFRNVRASAHVFVRAVRAGTDQTDLDVVWPAVLLGVFAYGKHLCINFQVEIFSI